MKPMTWTYIEEGYMSNFESESAAINVMLYVGHGLPATAHSNIQGIATFIIKDPQNPSRTAVNERLYFPVTGEVTAQFYSSDGITEDAGENWTIDHCSLIDSSTMDDGDETNDEQMKSFIEKHLKTITYEEEATAAKNEGF